MCGEVQEKYWGSCTMCLTAIFKLVITGPAILIQYFLSSAIQIKINQY